jgi:hypothetical protein
LLQFWSTQQNKARSFPKKNSRKLLEKRQKEKGKIEKRTELGYFGGICHFEFPEKAGAIKFLSRCFVKFGSHHGQLNAQLTHLANLNFFYTVSTGMFDNESR